MPRLEESEIDRRLGELDGWSLDGDAIVKQLDCHDFAGSVQRVNAVALLAEEMNHHPDLAISWSRLEIRVTTHSAGGLTPTDFELAKQIDALP